jgi:hypothetical protein
MGQNVWYMSLFEHFSKVLGLFIWKLGIQIRIRIKVKGKIPIRISFSIKGTSKIRIHIRIKVTRIRNTAITLPTEKKLHYLLEVVTQQAKENNKMAVNSQYGPSRIRILLVTKISNNLL